MKLTKNGRLGACRWMGLFLEVSLMAMAFPAGAGAQAVATTTVQGTVFLANGQPGAGTLDVSWPAFTTANNQAVAAGRITVTIAVNGLVSVNLAANQGATPAGLYYTAVYHMSDGTTSTEYWIVPATAQVNLAQARAQVMPAEQAVQAVSKAYVDQAIAALPQSGLSASGGTLTGPLYLNSDPTQLLQAADKHYVDSTFSKAMPVNGGTMTGPLEVPAVDDVQSPQAASAQTTLQATVNAAGSNGAVEIPPTYTGTDAFTNPDGVYVKDLRQGVAQQFERSVKEFGAVCDGVTDDTGALQAAIDYAQTHGVSLVLPQGTCKTQTLAWHGESIGGMGKQVSALMGFPGQDVLAAAADTPSFLANTRLHDLTIYVDASADVSCSAAKARAPAGPCKLNRPVESNSIFSPGANGLNGTAGTGAAWAVGNCAIALPATTGAGGNSLNVALMENVAIAATGADPMAQYTGAASTHTCGLYLAQWPKWTEFRNIDIRGVNTGIAMPALAGTVPAGLNADSNRWQNITIQAAHGFTMAAGSNNDLDNVVVLAANSAATGETPTGVILDFGASQQGWTIRNAVVLPAWDAVQPQLAVTAAGGAVTAVSVGSEHGLGFDPYGTQVPLTFSGSCTAQAVANVNSDGSIGSVSVTQGGTGCSGSTTASLNAAGTWDTAAPVNLVSGQNMAVLSGNLLKGNGGYTVWSAANSQSYGAKWGGGGVLPGGGGYPALVATSGMGSANPVDSFPGADFGAKLQACLGALSTAYGGTCDARNFTGSLSMGATLTISTSNATVLLPCATISTAKQIVVAAGVRNVSLRGCALRGGSTASGSQGGTAFLYSGAGAMVQVGDATYATDTNGFHMDNVAIDTTASISATAQGFAAYRTQEMDLESLYFLGNQNQTGMTLDGTGNYTGGTFLDNAFTGFQTAVNAIGHQVTNAATTDWTNASTFVRLHVDCPTSGGSPIAGTYGINLQQGDGNTFTGGDVEGCSTALHLGPNAQNNTIVGLRNENSTSQIVADAGSAYNNWIAGGTMFTGKLTDNGTRNSILDTFHRSFNGINGDWYGSQQDATVTNHYRLGTGAGNERGLLNRYQTDYGYRWTEGLSDATAGEQFYQLLDELNNVYRLSIGQYNHGQSSSNNQTVINAAGTGAIVLNGSNNAGTGGVIFGSGGASETSVATINNAGNAQFNGTLQVGGVSTFTGSTTVRNQADAEIDQFLWAGATANQKESFIYKDYAGNSQWYMVKDTSNNWALNSATGGLDSFKAYQSTNSGDTYIDASNTSGVVRVNYETGSGSGFNIYGGGTTSPLYASFTGTTAIKFPGLAATSGHSCLQIDNSGFITNTGSACGSASGGSGTVAGGTAGQIAYYSATGTQVGGLSTVPVSAGGTGSSTAAGALASFGTPVVSVTNYGAVSDALSVVDAQMSAGSAVLTSPSGLFTSAAVGKTISVQGAGANGDPLLTTIASYQSATQVTLATPAVTATLTGTLDTNGLTLSAAGTGYYDGVFATTTSGAGTGATVSVLASYGLSAVTAGSGGTIGGAGTCYLSPISSWSTGALQGAYVTVNFATSGSWNGATFAIDQPGWSPSNQFAGLQAALSSGTATCSGTATLTATGGLLNSGHPVARGSGYAVGDKVYPTVSGSSGTGYLTVTQVDGQGAIWGTDNYAAFQAAYNVPGPKRVKIPYGNYLVNAKSSPVVNSAYQGIVVSPNTITDMDRAGAIFYTGAQAEMDTYSIQLFEVPNPSGTDFYGLHVIGENLVPLVPFCCKNQPAILMDFQNGSWLGNLVQNMRITDGIFTNLVGMGIASQTRNAVNLDVTHNLFAYMTNSGINVNTSNSNFSDNTFVQAGLEVAGGPTHIGRNTFLDSMGTYAMSLGGDTSGVPFAGSQVSDNVIQNPYLANGCIGVFGGFSRGLIANNQCIGMTGGSAGVAVGLVMETMQGNVPVDTNTVSGNVFRGGLFYKGMLIATSNNILRNNFVSGATSCDLEYGSSYAAPSLISEGNYWGPNNYKDLCFDGGSVSMRDYVADGAASIQQPVSFTPDSILYTPQGSFAQGPLSGATVTASTQFSGPGTGLTGTAAGLSIGGNAATATIATNATNATAAATATTANGVQCNGSSGSAGQVLTSGGNGAACSWVTPSTQPSYLVVPASDVLCTTGGDTTVSSISITGIAVSSGIYTISLSSNPQNAGYYVGIKFQLAGTAGGSGNFNVADYIATAIGSASITATSVTSTGTAYGSGGNIALVCNNASGTDMNGAAFNSTVSLPPFTAPIRYQALFAMSMITPNGGNGIGVSYPKLSWNGSCSYGAQSVVTTPPAAWALGMPYYTTWDIVGTGSNAVFLAQDGGIYSQNSQAQPLAITTSGTNTVTMCNFTPPNTGLKSIASGSGGTIGGTGTCTLSSFNNGGSNASATVTFATSGSWTGATFTVNNRGSNFTAAPTSATLSSGAATCSGTATLTTALGTPQGYAIRLNAISAR